MSWANYEDVLEQLRTAGLLISSLEIDTPRPVRCMVKDEDRERRGWYWLHEILLNDDGGKTLYIVGSWGVWHGTDPGTCKLELRRSGKRRTLDRAQREAVNHRLREEKKRLKAQRQAEAERASRQAEAAWRKYLPQGESPYLEKKGVQAFGLRFSPSGNGTAAVPMTDPQGRIWGLQILRGPGRRKGLHEKEYWPRGMSKVGRYHLIGGTPRDVVLVAEGYATAASLHQATSLPVAVAFDAGNLGPTAEALAKAYRRVRILICADDDYRTQGNPGVTKASEAALSVGGKWIVPRFASERPTDGKKGPTDFNDLHQVEGLHVVRAQVEAFLSELGWPVETSPKPSSIPAPALEEGEPSPMVARLTVEDAVRRFCGTYGLGGKVLFDREELCLVQKEDVVALLPRGGLDDMRAHPDWEVVRADEIGFDPTGTDPKIRCNRWGGWPTTPRAGRCELLLELLAYLCSNEDNGRELYVWVLCWLAYPIQFPGAKMQTALLMHGPEGTGKNTFFGCIRHIYGKYGGIFSQTELDDKYNDWTSGKLYMIGNEVVTRAEFYHIQGRLKNMITEPEWQIRAPYQSARIEANHCNFVFFSNRIDIARLDRDDRRYCVVWTPPALDRQVYLDVAAEIETGGIAALHHYLLHLDLGDFGPHTKPPMTRAKRELIEISIDPKDRFWEEWRADDLPVPFVPCRTSDLYEAFRYFCTKAGYRFIQEDQKVIPFFAKQPGATRERVRHHDSFHSVATVQSTVLFPPGISQPPDKARKDWITEHVLQFRNGLDKWKDEYA